MLNSVAAVQHERGPRHSTLHRHISLCLKNSPAPSHHLRPAASSLSAANDLAARTPPPPQLPPASLYCSPVLPIRPMTFTSSSSPASSIFHFLNSHLSPASNGLRPYALHGVRFFVKFLFIARHTLVWNGIIGCCFCLCPVKGCL